MQTKTFILDVINRLTELINTTDNYIIILCIK